jgi:pimeloyl-ACP methyl ester carboxylesterase
MTTFILVHGAMHGGWCWYKVAARLEASGHRVLTPDLPGHGRNRASATPATFRQYVDHLAEMLRAEPEPVVLVGHSMGGAVITGAAEAVPEKVAKLVYLAAFMGPSGSSVIEWVGRPADDRVAASLDANMIRAMFYGDCSPEDVMLAQLCLTPQDPEPLIAPITWTPERWGRIPRAYIGCTQDQAIRFERQRSGVEEMPGTEFVVLEASHSPFFSMPETLVETLESLRP